MFLGFYGARFSIGLEAHRRKKVCRKPCDLSFLRFLVWIIAALATRLNQLEEPGSSRVSLIHTVCAAAASFVKGLFSGAAQAEAITTGNYLCDA